jgi:hypothetical protein
MRDDAEMEKNDELLSLAIALPIIVLPVPATSEAPVDKKTNKNDRTRWAEKKQSLRRTTETGKDIGTQHGPHNNLLHALFCEVESSDITPLHIGRSIQHFVCDELDELGINVLQSFIDFNVCSGTCATLSPA